MPALPKLVRSRERLLFAPLLEQPPCQTAGKKCGFNSECS